MTNRTMIVMVLFSCTWYGSAQPVSFRTAIASERPPAAAWGFGSVPAPSRLDQQRGGRGPGAPGPDGGGEEQKDATYPPLIQTGAERVRELLGDAPKIRGGMEACEIDAVGALTLHGRIHCTVSLIGERAVLTAAHCVAPPYPQSTLPYLVRFGCHAAVPNTVRSLHPHERQPGNPANDVAVVCLETHPAGIRTLALPQHQMQLEGSAIFVGFGYVVASDPYSAGTRRAAIMRIDELTASHFTYSGRIANTCYADSGGPAIWNNMIVGVTSKGDANCTIFGTDARVDTDEARAFIDEEARKCAR